MIKRFKGSFPYLTVSILNSGLTLLFMFFSFVALDVIDIYIDKKERIWIIDVNPFGEPTSALLFEWHELLTIEELDVRIVESEGEKLSSALGMKRGPVDVHLAPDFSNFLDICKRQAQEEDSDSDAET